MIKSNAILQINKKNIIYNYKLLSKIDVEALAKLPSLNDLRGKLVGLIQAPATKLLRVIIEPATQVLRTISQKSKQ